MIREVVEFVLEFLASTVGLDGIAIGALATTVAVLWYVREAADLFVLLARYARLLSIIGAVVLVLVVGGTASGVVESGELVTGAVQFVDNLIPSFH